MNTGSHQAWLDAAEVPDNDPPTIETDNSEQEGDRLLARGDVLRAEGDAMIAEGEKLVQNGYQLRHEATMLWSRGNTLKIQAREEAQQ